MKNLTLTATRLRLLLSFTLFVITALGIAAFVLGNGQLATAAGDVSKSVAEATASSNNLTQLQRLQSQLQANSDAVTRVRQVVADSQNYDYQNQIINDVTAYAGRAGLSISNISFATTAPVGAKPAAGATPATPAPTPAVAGLKPATVTVTLKSPVKYTDLLRFMKMVEQNLTKMQISRMSVARAEGGVSSEAINIDLFVRE